MNPSEILPLNRFSQAFEAVGFVGGASSSEISRRSFMKRTGRATVATLMAWNLASHEIRAANAFTSDSSPNWEVRSRAVGSKTDAAKEGFDNEENWTYKNVLYEVKRSLQMFASAPGNPADTPPATHHYANATTCQVSITLRKWASIKRTTNGNFDPMTNDEYAAWSGSSNWTGDITAAATLTQQIIDPHALDPQLNATTIEPDTEPERSHSDHDMTLYVWWEEEVLHMDFASVPGVQSTSSGELESNREFHTD